MDYSFLKNQKIDTTKSLIGGVVAGVIALALLIVFVKKPITEKIAQMESEISTARMQLKTNTLLAEQLPDVLKKRDALIQDLNKISTKLVSNETPVLWATEIVERQAAKEKITVRNFDAGGVNQLFTTDKNTKQRVFTPYEEFRTTANLWGSIHQFGRFMANLETEYPVMRIASFSLRARGKDPADGLVIQFNANYPQFSPEGFPPEKRPASLAPKIKSIE